MEKENAISRSEYLVACIMERANYEIRFGFEDNSETDLEKVLPEDGEEIIIAFPNFEFHSIIKHQKHLNYIQSPKRIVYNNGTEVMSKKELTYKKLWGRLNFKSDDKFIVKPIILKYKFEFVRKVNEK